MFVALLIVAVIGAIMCVVYALAQNLPAVDTYPARHRARGRVSWPAEVSMQLRRHMDRAKRAAFLAMIVVPVEPVVVEEPWIAELTVTPAGGDFDHPGLGGAGRYAHLRTDELDATAERVKALAERGIRQPSPWGTPEVADVWEPELVRAA